MLNNMDDNVYRYVVRGGKRQRERKMERERECVEERERERLLKNSVKKKKNNLAFCEKIANLA